MCVRKKSPGFCNGGLAVVVAVVEGDEAAVTFSPFIRSLRGAQCAESSAGPAQARKSSCPQELQLGNNTTKLLHPGSGSHMSGGSFRFRVLDI